MTETEFKRKGERNLPGWFEVEGDTRAAEDPADCVRRLDFEFVFLLGWWVADRDQQFVACDRWCREVTNRGDFRLCTGICSRQSSHA